MRSREVFRYHFLRSRPYFEIANEKVTKHVKRGPCDAVLQTQSFFSTATPNCPSFVYTDHVALANKGYGGSDQLMPDEEWIECERQIYEQARHVFTFGPVIRQLLIDAYGLAPEKVSVAGAGANVVPVAPVDTSLERYARRDVLFVGMAWERKGGPQLVEAFEKVARKFPDARLKIAGCSPVVTHSQIDVLGRLPREEIAPLFDKASLFCLPSLHEPFGIVVAEALHFALPVVATTVGEFAWTVGDGENGTRVPPGDVGALARALEQLLEDPERMRSYGLASLAKSPPFTWDVVADKILTRVMDET